MTEPYRPSNGTEGMAFQAEFCDRCEKDRITDKPCRLLMNALANNIGDPDFPAEWVEDDAGARCTAFQPHKRRARPAPDGRQESLWP